MEDQITQPGNQQRSQKQSQKQRKFRSGGIPDHRADHGSADNAQKELHDPFQRMEGQGMLGGFQGAQTVQVQCQSAHEQNGRKPRPKRNDSGLIEIFV